MAPKTFQDAVRENELLPCSTPGCTNRRKKIQKICRKCADYLARLGHPKARFIRPKVYLHHSREVQRIYRINEEHQAVKYYKQWFSNWVQLAQEAPNAVPASAWLRTMTPEMADDLILLWGGLWLHWKLDNPAGVPDSRAFYFHCVKLLMQYQTVPMRTPTHWMRAKAPERRNTALYLLRNIQPLLEGIQAALEAEEEERTKARALMAQPLSYERSILNEAPEV